MLAGRLRDRVDDESGRLCLRREHAGDDPAVLDVDECRCAARQRASVTVDAGRGRVRLDRAEVDGAQVEVGREELVRLARQCR